MAFGISSCAGLFVRDPASGNALTYDELLSHLNAPGLEMAPAFRPASVVEAFVGLVKALVAGRELTLYDADFSETELAALGADSVVLGRREHLGPLGVSDVPALLEKARRQHGFRLTLFTSGSTGLPKKVVHRLEGLTRMLRVGERHAGDVWGFAYNPTHIAGVQVFFQAFFNANPLINLFQQERSVIHRLLHEHRITHLSATPSFYRLLLPVEEPLAGVRAVTLGGERSDAALLRHLQAAFPNARLRNLYASTEAGTVLVAEGELFMIPEGLHGRVRISDQQIELHPELLGDFAAAARTADGWYRTGDMVEIVSDEPLRFRIVSRDRDWINVGGNKVSPSEVEEALRRFPGVREARVYGRKNSVLGEVLCAEVVAAPRPSEAEMRAHLAGEVQPFKVPRIYNFVEQIKHARTGKLKRL